jgi:hypothetical protein
MRVARRTFEALQFPKGSPDRTRLNADVLTSEYMPSHKYMLVTDEGKSTPFTHFRTKQMAEIYLEGLRSL